VVAIFGTALQLPPMHEPPQQGRPMLVRFCFSDEATTAFGWNLLQSRLMAFPPFLPTFSYHLLGRKSTMDFLLTLLAQRDNKKNRTLGLLSKIYDISLSLSL